MIISAGLASCGSSSSGAGRAAAKGRGAVQAAGALRSDGTGAGTAQPNVSGGIQAAPDAGKGNGPEGTSGAEGAVSVSGRPGAVASSAAPNTASGSAAGSGQPGAAPDPALAAKAQADAAAKAAAKAAADKAAAEAAAAKAERDRIAALEVPVPTVDVASGVFAAAVTVTIKEAQKEAKVVYTLDGSEPSDGNGLPVDAPIKISSSAVLKARAYVRGGKVSEVLIVDYTIGEVCAAPGGSGAGTRSAPLGSVAQAAAKAASLGIKILKLSAGTFEESLALSAPLQVTGGWRPDFSAQGDERSRLHGQAASSSTKKLPSAALVAKGKSADANLRFERIEFAGGDATYSAGVLVADGATPEFVDCSAIGGSGNYGYGVVSTSGANPRFRLSKLDGGAAATSCGLSVDGGLATVQSSYVLAGAGSVGCNGIVATDARVSVSSSVIAGGAGNVSYGAAFYNSKGSRLENCTVWGGKGKEVAGIFISASDPAVENCVVAANGSSKSFGIIANYGDSSPSLLSGNLFLGCAGGVYWDANTKFAYADFGTGGRLAGADGKALASPKGEGNSRATYGLDASWRLPVGATLPTVKTLSGPSTLDVLGKARPEPRYPGAY